MIELKRDNVHRIVETEIEAQNLIYEGYERITPAIINKDTSNKAAAKVEDFNLTVEKIDNMGILELKDIAKALKIKGYTNMGKSFLQKALKELV